MVEELYFECPNCGKFKTRRWEPMVGGMAHADCPICWKYLLQERIKVPVKPLNVPKKTPDARPNPLLYTNIPSQFRSPSLKSVVSEQKEALEPQSHNERLLTSLGVAPVQIKMFDLYLRGVKSKDISEATGDCLNYINMSLGRIKNHLLPHPAYSKKRISTRVVLIALRELGLEVDVDRWEALNKESKRQEVLTKAANVIKRKEAARIKEQENIRIIKSARSTKPERKREMSGQRLDLDINEEMPYQKKLEDLKDRGLI